MLKSAFFKSAKILRGFANAHRYVCFVNGRIFSFLTDISDINRQLAALFGTLNAVAPEAAANNTIARSMFDDPGAVLLNRTSLVQRVGMAILTLAIVNGSLIAPALALDPGALPTDPTSVVGGHNFDYNGNTLNVSTGADRSIVNWGTFNVGSAATVNFALPGASSAILNRVISGQLSEIYGTINSNGRVFLINPAGIFFGGTAVINTAGLVASTLNITTEKFLAGQYQFMRDINSPLGSITIASGASINVNTPGGVATFLASQFINAGNITAQDGHIQVAVGDRVTLGDDLIGFNVDQGLQSVLNDVAISNSGSLSAANIKIAADTIHDSIMDVIVNNTGRISANKVVDGIGGTIELIADTGTIQNTGIVDASGTEGGQVHIEGELVENSGDILALATEEDSIGGTVKVLGDKIHLTGTSNIDVSGQAGGGTVLVGGDYRGENAAVRNADVTYVAEGSTIAANAGQTGDGGKVIVWADDTTVFNGNIEAKGGAESGNGGFVETSGKENLAVETGSVDASAANGERGLWVLDPTTLNIAAAGSGFSTPPSSVLFGDGAGTYNIANTALNTATTDILLEATQDINFNAAVNVAQADVNLTARANNDINVNATITTNSGDINFLANADSAGGGRVHVKNVIDTNGGDFTATGSGSNPNISAIAVDGTGAFSGEIRTDGGDITLNGSHPGTWYGVRILEGGVLNSGGGDITVNAASSNNHGMSLEIGTIDAAGGNVFLNGSTADAPSFGISQQSGFSVASANGNITYTTNRLDLQGTANTGATGTVSILPTSGTEVLVGGTAADSVTQLGVSAAELGKISTGTLNIGNTTINGGLKVVGDLALNSLGYNLNLANGGTIQSTNNILNRGTHQLSFATAGPSSDVIIANGNSQPVNITGITAGRDIKISTGNSAGVTVSDDLTATAGGITISNASTSALQVDGDITAKGDIDLNNTAGGFGISPISVNNVSSAAGNISIRTAGGHAVGANDIKVTGTITTPNTLTLEVGRTTTDVGNITNDGTASGGVIKTNVGQLDIKAAGGTVKIREANDVNIIGANLQTSGSELGDLTLRTQGNGNITQSGDITGVDSLNVVTQKGDITLTNIGNSVERLRVQSADGDLAFTNGSDLKIQQINLNSNNDGVAGDATLTVAGALNQNVNNNGIRANELSITANRFDLQNAKNDVTTLSFTANASGDNFFTDADGITVSGTTPPSVADTVTIVANTTGIDGNSNPAGAETDLIIGTAGLDVGHQVSLKSQTTGGIQINGQITTHNSIVELDAVGDITQGAAIITDNLRAESSAGSITLTNAGNDADVVAFSATAAGKSVNYVDADGFDVGQVVGASKTTTGIQANDQVGLKAVTSSITQTQAITANELAATAVDDITLAAATNNVASFAANSTTGNVTYTDANDVQVAAITTSATGALAGVTVGSFKTVGLSTVNGNLSQAGGSVISGGSLFATAGGTGKSINLSNADFGTVTLKTTDGTVFYQDFDGVNVSGLNVGAASATVITHGAGTTASNGLNEIELALNGTNKAGTLNLTANKGNISQVSGTLDGVNLNALTADVGKQIFVTNADFSNIKLDTNNGGVTYRDKDGFNATVNVGTVATVNLNSFDGGVAADNGNAEAGLTFSGFNQAGTFNVVASQGDINQAGLSTIQGDVLNTQNSEMGKQMNLNDADFNLVSIKTNDGDALYQDSDGFSINANTGTMTGTGTIRARSFMGGTASNGGAESKITLTGANQATQYSFWAKNGNIEQALGSTVAGNTLNAQLDGGAGASLTLGNADFSSVFFTSASSNFNYTDRDGFALTSSNMGTGTFTGTSFGVGVTADNLSADGSNLFVLGNNTAGTFNLTANQAAISQSGTIQGINLNATTVEAAKTITFNDADFTNVKLTSNNGNVTYKDNDGFNITVNAGNATANLTSFDPAALADNGVAEGDMVFVGNNTAGTFNLTANGGSIKQGPGSSLAGGTLIVTNTTVGGALEFSGVDFATINLTTNNGDITVADRDGYNGTFNAGTGNVKVSGGNTVTANNFIDEGTVAITGTNSGKDFTVTGSTAFGKSIAVALNNAAVINATEDVTLNTTGNNANVTLNGDINAGATVTVSTVGTNSDINQGNNSDVQAGGHIDVKTSGVDSGITLNGDWNSDSLTSILVQTAANNADIDINNGSVLSSDGTVTVETLGAQSQIDIDGDLISDSGVIVRSTGTNSDITLENDSTLNANASKGAGTVSITTSGSDGDITQDNGSTIDAVGGVTVSTTGNTAGITQNGDITNTAGNVLVSTTGDNADIAQGNSGDITANATVTISTDGDGSDISLSGNATKSTAGNINVQALAGNSNITIVNGAVLDAATQVQLRTTGGNSNIFEDGDLIAGNEIKIVTEGNGSDITLQNDSTLISANLINIQTTGATGSDIFQIAGSTVDATNKVVLSTVGTSGEINLAGEVDSASADVSVTTTGTDSDITVAGSGLVEGNTNVLLSTTGPDSQIILSGDVTAQTGSATASTTGLNGAITQNNGSVVTGGSAVTFSTAGNNADIDQNGDINSTGTVNVSTTGDDAGITQSTTGDITATGIVTISTDGDDSDISLSGNATKSTGANINVQTLAGNSDITIVNGAVLDASSQVQLRTAGANSDIYEDGDLIAGNEIKIITESDGSDITLQNDSTLISSNVINIQTTGANASDIFQIAGSTVDATNNIALSTLGTNAEINIAGELDSAAGDVSAKTTGDDSPVILQGSGFIDAGKDILLSSTGADSNIELTGDMNATGKVTVSTTGNSSEVNQAAASNVNAGGAVLVKTTGTDSNVNLDGDWKSTGSTLTVQTTGNDADIDIDDTTTLDAAGALIVETTNTNAQIDIDGDLKSNTSILVNTTGATSNITLENDSDITTTGAGTITVSTSGTGSDISQIDGSDVKGPGAVTYKTTNANADITLSGDSESTASTLTVSTTGIDANITLAASGDVKALNTVSIATAGSDADITLQGKATSTGADVNVSTISNSSEINQNFTSVVAGATDVTYKTDGSDSDITLNGTTNSGGTVNVSTDGFDSDIWQQNTAASINATGNVNMKTTGDWSWISLSGDTTSTTGNILLETQDPVAGTQGSEIRLNNGSLLKADAGTITAKTSGENGDISQFNGSVVDAAGAVLFSTTGNSSGVNLDGDTTSKTSITASTTGVDSDINLNANSTLVSTNAVGAGTVTLSTTGNTSDINQVNGSTVNAAGNTLVKTTGTDANITLNGDMTVANAGTLTIQTTGTDADIDLDNQFTGIAGGAAKVESLGNDSQINIDGDLTSNTSITVNSTGTNSDITLEDESTLLANDTLGAGTTTITTSGANADITQVLGSTVNSANAIKVGTTGSDANISLAGLVDSAKSTIDITTTGSDADITLETTGLLEANGTATVSTTNVNSEIIVNGDITSQTANVLVKTTGNTSNITQGVNSVISAVTDATLQTGGTNSDIFQNGDINSAGTAKLATTGANSDINQSNTGDIDADGAVSVTTTGSTATINLDGNITSDTSILVKTSGTNSTINLLDESTLLANDTKGPGTITISTTGNNGDINQAFGSTVNAANAIVVSTTNANADISLSGLTDSAKSTVSVTTTGFDSDIDLNTTGLIEANGTATVSTAGTNSDINVNGDITSQTANVLVKTTGGTSDIAQGVNSVIDAVTDVTLSTTGFDSDIDQNGDIFSDNTVNIKTTNALSSINQNVFGDITADGAVSITTTGGDSNIGLDGDTSSDTSILVSTTGIGADINLGANSTLVSTNDVGGAGTGTVTITTTGSGADITQQNGSSINAEGNVLVSTDGLDSNINLAGDTTSSEEGVTIQTLDDFSDITLQTSADVTAQKVVTIKTTDFDSDINIQGDVTSNTANVAVTTNGSSSDIDQGANSVVDGETDVTYSTTGNNSDITLAGDTLSNGTANVTTTGTDSDIELTTSADIEATGAVIVSTTGTDSAIDIDGDITSQTANVLVSTIGNTSDITQDLNSVINGATNVTVSTTGFGSDINQHGDIISGGTASVTTTGNFAEVTQNDTGSIDAVGLVNVNTTGFSSDILLAGDITSQTSGVQVFSQGDSSTVTTTEPSSIQGDQGVIIGSMGNDSAVELDGDITSANGPVLFGSLGDNSPVRQGANSTILASQFVVGGTFGNTSDLTIDGDITSLNSGVSLFTFGLDSDLTQNSSSAINALDDIDLFTFGDDSEIYTDGLIHSQANVSIITNGLNSPITQDVNGDIEGQEVDIRTLNDSNITLTGLVHGSDLLQVTTEGSTAGIVINGPAFLSSDNGQIFLQSNFMDIQGQVNAGTTSGFLMLSAWDPTTTIGLGGGAGVLNITNDEFQNLNARDIFFGDQDTNTIMTIGYLDARGKANTDLTFNNRYWVQESTPNNDSGVNRWNIDMANNRNAYFTGGATGVGDRLTAPGIQFIGDINRIFGDIDIRLPGSGLAIVKSSDGNVYSGKSLRIFTGDGWIYINGQEDDDGSKLRNLAGALGGRVGTLIDNQVKGTSLQLPGNAFEFLTTKVGLPVVNPNVTPNFNF